MSPASLPLQSGVNSELSCTNACPKHPTTQLPRQRGTGNQEQRSLKIISRLRDTGNVSAIAGFNTLAISVKTSEKPLLAVCLACAAVVFLIVFSGCATQVRSQLEDSFAARKAESLRGWQTETINGGPLPKSIQMRTAMLFRNYDSISAKIDGDGIHIKATTKLKRQGFGSAIPIAKDGYFLTAGHIVRDASALTLVAFSLQENGDPQAQEATARIVWAPDQFGRGPDIAIVHTGLRSLSPFALAANAPQVYSPIMTAGWPLGLYDSFPEGSRIAAGRIVAVERQPAESSSPSFVVVRHDAPLVSGDSGGPVVDREGNVIGVNASYRFSFWQGLAVALGRAPPPPADLGYSAIAIMPDTRWLRELIQRDRNRPRNKMR